MGKSGNPAKRAAQQGKHSKRPTRRDGIEVSVIRDRGLVVLDVGGELTGMTIETTDALIMSLTNARNDLMGNGDRRPHSRACGIGPHEHGAACSKDCPTCHGDPLAAGVSL